MPALPHNKTICLGFTSISHGFKDFHYFHQVDSSVPFQKVKWIIFIQFWQRLMPALSHNKTICLGFTSISHGFKDFHYFHQVDSSVPFQKVKWIIFIQFWQRLMPALPHTETICLGFNSISHGYKTFHFFHQVDSSVAFQQVKWIIFIQFWQRLMPALPHNKTICLGFTSISHGFKDFHYFHQVDSSVPFQKVKWIIFIQFWQRLMPALPHTETICLGFNSISHGYKTFHFFHQVDSSVAFQQVKWIIFIQFWQRLMPALPHNKTICLGFTSISHGSKAFDYIHQVDSSVPFQKVKWIIFIQFWQRLMPALSHTKTICLGFTSISHGSKAFDYIHQVDSSVPFQKVK